MVEKDNLFSDEVLEDFIRKAFVDLKKNSILIDSYHKEGDFEKTAVKYGFNKGWLEVIGELNERYYAFVNYGLTDEGKEYFKIE
ncbi:MAG: hypothetical protein ABIB43_06840 [archaeon]